MKSIILTFLMTLSLSAAAKELKVMQYNGENFFDTSFDQGTEDFTYLPLSVKRTLPGHADRCHEMSSTFYVDQCLKLDWNDSKFTKKILNIAKVIKAFDKTGMGPDIIVMEEIENKNVLSKLVSKGLDKMGYKYIELIEGDDSRGIDVGVISKFPITSSRHHSLMIDGQKIDTRGILEVTIDVDGHDVVVFANHWPSQSNPTLHRIESGKLLNRLASQKKADLILALGDFNTLLSERPYPLDELTGFIDSEKEAREINSNLNGGTHFYRGEWSSLDKIYIFKNAGMKPLYDQYEIMTPSFMMKRDNRSGEMVPVRFDHETATGYSDHLPVKMVFKY